MTAAQYEHLSRGFRTAGRQKALQAVDILLTGTDFLLFPMLVVRQLFIGDDWLRTVLGAGVPFLLLSLFRKCINRPRPYETLNIIPLLKKDSAGCSFPSRHVFSAFLIAMCYLSVNFRAGVGLLFLGGALALVRVIGGVHYPSDVTVGALLGILCGYLSFFVL